MLMNNLNIIEPEEENSKSKVISIAPGQYYFHHLQLRILMSFVFLRFMEDFRWIKKKH